MNSPVRSSFLVLSNAEAEHGPWFTRVFHEVLRIHIEPANDTSTQQQQQKHLNTEVQLYIALSTHVQQSAHQLTSSDGSGRYLLHKFESSCSTGGGRSVAEIKQAAARAAAIFIVWYRVTPVSVAGTK